MPPKFVPRVRKQKAKREETALRQRATAAFHTAEKEENETKGEREARKQKIRQEIEAQRSLASHISSKKRKRLVKYVEGKVRKEENADLVRKLAEEHENADTSLLRSSRNLGRSTEYRREAAGRALREERAGLTLANDDSALYQRNRPTSQLVIKAEEDTDVSSTDRGTAPPRYASTLATDATESPSQPAFGVGLRKPLELDGSGQPVIRTRQRKKRKLDTSSTLREDEWSGFSDRDETVSSGNSHSSIAAGDSSDASSTDTDDSPSSQEDESINGTRDGCEADESNEDASAYMDAVRASTEARMGRKSAFELFASQARNTAVDSTHTNVISAVEMPSTVHTQVHKNKTCRIGLPLIPAEKQVHSVLVERTPQVQDSRSKLPIVAAEQSIMEAVRNNNIIIVDGETGSGKTTQVPQFLFEAGFGDRSGPTPGMIGVTQPRRVAAVSMAERVAFELSDVDRKVSYQIRFDGTVNKRTAIKFMTDGVLLREVAQDFMLRKYSALVIDEAHERSINTDILIGMLTRIVDMREEYAAKKGSEHKPLKLIIMSATLRVHDFTSNRTLFKQRVPPVIRAEGRTHEVTVHWARRTQRDYVGEAFHKVSKGHRKLPPGGILVFLTGQNEIAELESKLRKALRCTNATNTSKPSVTVLARTSMTEAEDLNITRHVQSEVDAGHDTDVETRAFDSSEEDREFEIDDSHVAQSLDAHIFCLHSKMNQQDQMRVFEPIPEGSRAIVLATNIAETSLTIPGIRYVFDCGRAKERNFDRQSGVQSFDIAWISKAAAQQRKGRAGRTGPGHCYRLYSSAVYERDFTDFSAPEIVRAPLEDVVLKLKSMGVPRVEKFPFPTPPDSETLLKAEKLLEFIGALKDGRVTPTGHRLSNYPLSPRLARIIVLSHQYDCLDHALALVAALSVQEMFVTETQLQLTGVDPERENSGDVEQKALLRRDYRQFQRSAASLDPYCDALKLYEVFRNFVESQSRDTRFVRVKALQEALQLRNQLSAIVANYEPGSMRVATDSTQVPRACSSAIKKKLRQLVAAGYIDQVAVKAENAQRAPQGAANAPYMTLFPSYDEADLHERMRFQDEQGQRRLSQERFVYIHPSSVLAHVHDVEKLPKYIIYSHLSRAAPSSIAGSARSRTRMHPLTPITAEQILSLAEGTPLIEHSNPIGRIETLERLGGHERRRCQVVPFLKGPAGSVGWPLASARNVVQKRIAGKGWVTEQ